MRAGRWQSLVTLIAALALAALLSPVAADAAPVHRLSRDVGGNYVVSYAAKDQGAALKAVRKAGGTVISAQPEIGLALVSAKAGFAAKVRQQRVITGAMLDVSIGGVRPNMAPVRATQRLTAAEADAVRKATSQPKLQAKARATADPLTSLQWDMKMINTAAAHRVAQGKGVKVGIIDTGVDASHPDIAPHFSYRLSRNFTHDIPAIDGPCEVPSCVDPAWVDQGGHGTHVAGTVAAARNGIGITGVAPKATIVNVRAGQDSGYFFLYETAAALVYSGLVGLDVVNMSFYTDPWLYNCDSADDYVSGTVTPEQLFEQRMIRHVLLAATGFAHARGVTMVSAAGNEHTDLAAPTRTDDSSPDYPEGTAQPRVVSKNCLNLPTEAPHVIRVGAVGPSTTKADYSSYGLGEINVTAPGGWFRDGIGTPSYRTVQNEVLSSYPYQLAIEEGLLAADGTPQVEGAYSACDRAGRCGAWWYLQGTSMASPHVAGEAALVVQAHGRWRHGSYHISPNRVTRIIERTAVDRACPIGGVEIYTDEGRDPSFNATCQGTTEDNGLYGEGIIDAAAAVRSARP